MIASDNPSAFKYRSSTLINAASCAPAEWPITKNRFGSPPYSAMWSLTQRADRATSRIMVVMSTAGNKR